MLGANDQSFSSGQPLCKVCGGDASGFHYGVDSCEGCKGFFRRCLTQGLNSKCTNDQKCDITPLSRNSCQFCRLKKCKSVGMSKEGSRLGRRPKRLKQCQNVNLASQQHHQQPSHSHHQQPQQHHSQNHPSQQHHLQQHHSQQHHPSQQLQHLYKSQSKHLRTTTHFKHLNEVPTENYIHNKNGDNSNELQYMSGKVIVGEDHILNSVPTTLNTTSVNIFIPLKVDNEFPKANPIYLTPSSIQASSDSLSAFVRPQKISKRSPSENHKNFLTTRLLTSSVVPQVIAPQSPQTHDLTKHELKQDGNFSTNHATLNPFFLFNKTNNNSTITPRNSQNNNDFLLTKATTSKFPTLTLHATAPLNTLFNPSTSLPFTSNSFFTSSSILPSVNSTPEVSLILNPPIRPAGLSLEGVRGPYTFKDLDVIDHVIARVSKAYELTCVFTWEKYLLTLEKYNRTKPPETSTLTPAYVWSKFMTNMTMVIQKVVRFCKKLPGFRDLSQEDQIILIKQGSFEVIHTRYAKLIQQEAMFVPDMSLLVPISVIEKTPMGDFFVQEWRFALVFNRLALTDEEMALLNAITIIWPDRAGLENRKKVESMNFRFLQALYVYMKKTRPNEYEEMFSKTINMIPYIRDISKMHSIKVLNLNKQKNNLKNSEEDNDDSNKTSDNETMGDFTSDESIGGEKEDKMAVSVGNNGGGSGGGGGEESGCSYIEGGNDEGGGVTNGGGDGGSGVLRSLSTVEDRVIIIDVKEEVNIKEEGEKLPAAFISDKVENIVSTTNHLDSKVPNDDSNHVVEFPPLHQEVFDKVLSN